MRQRSRQQVIIYGNVCQHGTLKMKIGTYRFDRLEFAGSLGDLGTLIPLSIALIVITGLSVSSVFLMVGLFYVVTGLYYKLPIPVQPLKVVAAIAIAFPDKITLPIIAASGLTFGLIFLLLALSGIIDWLERFFTRPIIRGIQLGLGFILVTKGIQYILSPELFLQHPAAPVMFAGIPFNLAIGVIGFLVTLSLLSNERFPSALILVSSGIVVGILFGALNNITITLGPTSLEMYWPSSDDFINALILVVIPQVPLTVGNAVMSTTDTCYTLFGKGSVTHRVTNRALAASIGLINILTGTIGGMPMCHGAGGLMAHYRFGARTGGSNIMIGMLFIILALAFGKIGIALLTVIPRAILGILLLFAGLELVLLIRDMEEKRDLFIAFLIASIGFATTNMGIAFFTGILVLQFMKWKKIEF